MYGDVIPEKDKRNSGRLMRKAAKVLNDRGWTRGVWVDQTGEVCIRGAMNLAYCGNAKPRHECKPTRVADLLFRDLFNCEIINFNDVGASSKEEVIAAMEKFADHYDPQR